ncbi:MAG: GAF domain-containing protein, partial [Pedobacter sp.]
MMTSSATLTNCDIESIHIPGSTQSHGFVMVLSKSFGITACSQNIIEYTGLDAANLIGKEIGELAALLRDKDLAQGLKSLIAYSAKQFEAKSAGRFQAVINDQLFDISVSVDQEHYLLDFEPVISNITQDVQSMVGRSLSEILSDKSLTRLLNNAAQQVRSIIGYDRVMIYKFHNDGHGEVIAEAKNDDLETWMGLHYPASDIPKPARELYKINQIRLIADVYANTSPIISVENTPLDLTNSHLRAVSPIHIQYLKNMGVASSFSISIMNHDRLWGLIACHSYTPRIINVNERESAKLVGQVLSSAIVFREQEEEQQQSAVYRQCIETITRYLLRNIAVEDALFNEECSMLEVVESSGAVLYFENNLREVGKTPDSKFINQLIDWLDTKISEDGCYMTNKLSDDFPQALPYSNEVC